MKLSALLIVPFTALLASCAVPGEGVYGDAGYDYDYWGGDHYHHSGSSHHRHVPTRYTSKDDVRKDADHRTSPSYRDPHHGGSKHGHDSEGHRVDSHGHHVDAVGHHTDTPKGSSHDHSRESSSSSHSSAEPSRHESSKSDDGGNSRTENKSDDSGRRGRD